MLKYDKSKTVRLPIVKNKGNIGPVYNVKIIYKLNMFIGHVLHVFIHRNFIRRLTTDNRLSPKSSYSGRQHLWLLSVWSHKLPPSPSSYRFIRKPSVFIRKLVPAFDTKTSRKLFTILCESLVMIRSTVTLIYCEL